MKIIIDGNNLCHIVNHKTGHLSDDDRPTGVVFGFMIKLLNMCRVMKTNEFIFCWDSQKSLRKLIYPEYKSNRNNKPPVNPAEKLIGAFRGETKEEIIARLTMEKEAERSALFNQISELRSEIIPALGFKNNFIKTGYEADDLIAYIVLMNPAKEFTIVSTDHDLYQLLSNNVRIYNTVKKTFYTKQDFEAEFNLSPVMFREVKAISGCTSDFIKGIQGVGDSTAAKYVRGDKISPNLLDRIKEGVDVIARNRRLTYLPFLKEEQRGAIPKMGMPLRKDELQLSNFKRLFNQLSFVSLLKDISSWEQGFKL